MENEVARLRTFIRRRIEYLKESHAKAELEMATLEVTIRGLEHNIAERLLETGGAHVGTALDLENAKVNYEWLQRADNQRDEAIRLYESVLNESRQQLGEKPNQPNDGKTAANRDKGLSPAGSAPK